MSALNRDGAVQVRAPGKLNVFFAVGEVMDDGYHDVASAYQAVSLYEEVRAEPANGFSVAFTGPVNGSALPLDSENLAIRAARALARKFDYEGGVHLDIEKHVPIAGGMGGGSADAAATLVACDALWGLGATRDELHEVAVRLGADVPFALTGGTAIGTGRGDKLSPALATGTFHWVLALADFPLSTPQVYAELDAHRARHKVDIGMPPVHPQVSTEVLQALRAGDAEMLAEAMGNDLQVAALHLAPQLAAVLELGEKNGALGGMVTGSGPTIAFLAADPDTALELQVALSASRVEAVHVTGPVHGPRVTL